MPLTLVRSESNARLWSACVSRFFAQLGDETRGPPYAAHLWLAHRAQRDLLLRAAAERDHPGWLAPPVSFFSELPSRFGITKRPIGLLTGRMLLGRIAAATATSSEFAEGGAARGHLIDRTLSELLPEGVPPAALEAALARLPGDEFSRGRNRWLVETYGAYLTRLEEAGQFDPRAIHALVAERVREGGLSNAVSGAVDLHVYGPTTLHGRRRLFEALAAQREVRVSVYLPAEPESGEWEEIAQETERLPPTPGDPSIEVQPTPDAVREAAWVARSIKVLLAGGDTRPSEVAVIARSGRGDTRRIREALERAGVPSTARLRSRLDEIPALRGALQLFEGLAEDWPWGLLRAALANPYLEASVDLRGIDYVATRARPRGLEAWIEHLEKLLLEAKSDRGWKLERAGVRAAGLERDLAELRAFTEAVAPLAAPRPEAEWIDATRALLRGHPLGLRERACRSVGGRWDVVRLDQRGILALDGLLREWRDLLGPAAEPLDAASWYRRLRQLLRANEIAISTPMQQGVQVLEAHEAALTPFAQAFIVHANEGEWPPRAPGGLFTEAERARLVELGIPLATRAVRLERERRLWRACVGSPSVAVSYRTSDANGVPRLPSLFVPPHDRRRELPRTRRPLPGTVDGPAPATRDEWLEAELRAFAAERRGPHHAKTSTPHARRLRHAVLAAFAEELRSGGLDHFARPVTPHGDDGDAAIRLFGNDRPLSERPTPWNGELRDPAVLAALSGAFPPEREWSASQLEQYGRRPFDFLLERVLGLVELREADDEADRLTVGALVHAVLERFYREWPTDDEGRGAARRVGGAATADWEDRFAHAFEAACEEYERAEDRWLGLHHVWVATRAQLRERLREFVRWELGQADVGEPVAVELAFGRRAGTEPVDLSGPGRDGGPRVLRLGGQIDRVDRLGGDGNGPLRIIDYKSGTTAPPAAGFEDAATLQNVLYMAAVEALGLGTPAIAWYRTIARPANVTRRRPADIEPTLRLAREIPDRVRRGLFEAVQARSTPIADWQPGRDVVRCETRISSGTRFDPVTPVTLADAVGEEEPA